MTGYKLMFDGVQFGDEILLPAGFFKSDLTGVRKISLEQIVPIDDSPLGLAVYPRFRVRKKAADLWDFERWVFDLLAWADGRRRSLLVLTAADTLIADYGMAKFLSLTRPHPSGPHAARTSDQVVLTFQSNGQPIFS